MCSPDEAERSIHIIAHRLLILEYLSLRPCRRAAYIRRKSLLKKKGYQYHYLVRLKQAVFRDFAILAGFRLFHGFAGRRRRPAILADFIHFKPISSISTSFHGF